MNRPPSMFGNHWQPFPQPHHPRQWNNFEPRPRGFQPRNHRPQYSRPLTPRNEDYWCETCDRGFPTAAILENHKQQHQKCNIDGCNFVAHPKVITKHIQMQHSSGLFKKIAKLNNPQEIEKWREERKRRYPTKENVERKVAEINEKIERGEKMGLNKDKRNKNESGHNNKRKHFGMDKNCKNKRFKSKCNKNDNNNKVFENHSEANKLSKPNHTKNESHKKVSDFEEKRTLTPFAGIQKLMDFDEVDTSESQEKNDLIEDDDEEYLKGPETIAPEMVKASEPSVCGALSSLMCDYESTDDETETNQSCNNISTETDNVSKKDCMEAVVCPIQNMDNNDDSGPEEVKIVKPDVTSEAELNKTLSPDTNIHYNSRKKPENKFVRKKPLYTKPKPKLPSTLLQKLLHTEIQHERNVVLQCIRYIVNNNYFDKN